MEEDEEAMIATEPEETDVFEMVPVIKRLRDSEDSLDSLRSDKVRSCFIPINQMSFRKKGMSFLRNIYTATNDTPNYYREQKRNKIQENKLKHYLRKIAGIPVAIGYAFLLLWIISKLIMTPVINEHSTFEDNEIPKDICALLTMPLPEKNDTLKNVSADASPSPVDIRKISFSFAPTSKTHTTKSSNQKTGNKTSTQSSIMQNYYTHSELFPNIHKGLYYGTFAAMSTVGGISFFSSRTRSILILILPGLMTKNSRNFIFTIVFGIVSMGPWNNIKHNVVNLFKNGACMYRTGILSFSEKESLLRDVWTNAKRIKYRNASCVTTVAAISLIKQMSLVLEKVNYVSYIIEIARKCLTLFIILLLIFDAYSYLRLYCTDSSFDNKHIEGSIPKYWEEKNYKQVVPLKKWERSKGFSQSNLPSIKRKSKLLKTSLLTVIFIIFNVLVLVIDYVIALALKEMKENEDYHISIRSQSISGGTTYNAKQCLTDPYKTRPFDYVQIALLLFTALVSCILEVYASRLRARMCNLFYPDKAEERADYLFYKIYSGRVVRRFKLLMIVRREMERREKLARFSPLKKFSKYLSKTFGWKKEHIICPGCQTKIDSSEAEKIFFDLLSKSKSIGSSVETSNDSNSDDGLEGNINEFHRAEVSAMVCKECDHELLIGRNKVDDLFSIHKEPKNKRKRPKKALSERILPRNRKKFKKEKENIYIDKEANKSSEEMTSKKL